MKVSLTVNERPVEADLPANTLLSDLIRGHLGLTGTHVGCDTSQCGACTIHMDGRAVKSCAILAVQADGASITTIEGLAPEGGLHPLQQGFWDNHGLQCGFCTPGMIMCAADLLAREPDPDETEVRHAIEGNYCRCTGYHNIVRAVMAAAETMRGEAASTSTPAAS